MINNGHQHPVRIVNAVAPIRICDNGGWTDTWFAEYGKIFNIGVYPYAEVQIEVYPYEGLGERIVIHAENYGERFAVPDSLREMANNNETFYRSASDAERRSAA